MSAPSPDVIDRVTAKAISHLEQASKDYGYLFPSAYTKRQAGEGENVSGGGESDLSDMMVGDIAAYRRDIEDAARALFESFRRVEIARARLNDAASRIDRRAPLETDKHERALAHPADKGEVRQAQRAQKRRGERLRTHRFPWSREEVTG